MHLRQLGHLQGDETGWQVFAIVESKVGYHWYLWLVRSAEVAVFTLAGDRDHDVPDALLGDDTRGSSTLTGIRPTRPWRRSRPVRSPWHCAGRTCTATSSRPSAATRNCTIGH